LTKIRTPRQQGAQNTDLNSFFIEAQCWHTTCYVFGVNERRRKKEQEKRTTKKSDRPAIQQQKPARRQKRQALNNNNKPEQIRRQNLT
jgi:hypothetical protein